MKVLLLRPDPVHERFGLGPFFRVEPLGLEYLAAAVRDRNVECQIGDLRFMPSLERWLRRARPALVGISCTHVLELDEVLGAARAVRRLAPGVTVVVGGHAAAAFPEPFDDPAIDAVCVADGEAVMPALLEAMRGRRKLGEVPGLLVRRGGALHRTGPVEQPSLDAVPLPARELVEHHRRHYLCLNYQPIWLLETMRGCPYRCSFCSISELYGRTVRERSIGAVASDYAAVGPNLFVSDDLFWHHPARSRELALALRGAAPPKHWMLVQARLDTVARHPELLELWRPVAERIDIFFGFETPTDEALDGLGKDASVADTVRGIETARAYGYGVTGNFVIDPDSTEADFERLWDFVATHKLRRAGYTVLTPLPGTPYFSSVQGKIAAHPWSSYDMHHLPWEPRLGAARFFELFAETWRRSVLNIRGEKRLGEWAKQVELRHVPKFLQVLYKTQRLMDGKAYLRAYERDRAWARPRGSRAAPARAPGASVPTEPPCGLQQTPFLP